MRNQLGWNEKIVSRVRWQPTSNLPNGCFLELNPISQAATQVSNASLVSADFVVGPHGVALLSNVKSL